MSVIFLEVSAPALHALHADLQAALGSHTQSFHPHLTLALSWRPLGVEWQAALRLAQREFADLALSPFCFTAHELTLFEKRHPGQPYAAVEHFALSIDKAN